MVMQIPDPTRAEGLSQVAELLSIREPPLEDRLLRENLVTAEAADPQAVEEVEDLQTTGVEGLPTMEGEDHLMEEAVADDQILTVTEEGETQEATADQTLEVMAVAHQRLTGCSPLILRPN